MYVPNRYQVTDEQRLFDVLEQYSFAALVNVIDNAPFVTHVPLLLDRERRTLFGHLANENPQVEALFDGQQTLAVFQGPHAYISPRWYAKLNVPTWNYVAVHAYGHATRLDDAGLTDLLERLTASNETSEAPFRPDMLPADQLVAMHRVITGFALPITQLQGKFKLSQNRRRADREGAISAVAEQGHEELACFMSTALKEDR